MTAARLEELAVWAQSQADWCAGQDLPHDIGGKYADLARCARGWAGFDALIRQQGSSAVAIWATVDEKRAILTQQRCVTGDTLLEAVEAAEVKP